ncbi:MAG: AAA family ATPase [Gammaproteobacteria bacterium]|nr:AAA family ATPase [Gammaproteobacteria bacterium]
MNAKVSGLKLKDIRRFAMPHDIPLSKINLLVGENSIGKTTLLGAVNALGCLANFKDYNGEDLTDQKNYFSRPPFDFGEFDTLVRRGCMSFQVGFEFDAGPMSQFLMEFTQGDTDVFREEKLELSLPNKLEGQPEKLKISREKINGEEHWLFEGPGFVFRLPRTFSSFHQFTTWLSRDVRRGQLPFNGDTSLFDKSIHPKHDEKDHFVKFVNFFRSRMSSFDLNLKVIAIAPNLMQQQRIYRDNSLSSINDKHKRAQLCTLGRELGIFNDIQITKVAGGFEVHVKLGEEFHNIQDVGLGVSSVLPFLEAFINADAHSIFLLQHPEVHLHPQSQAEMVKVMARSDHSFIIETHSDHFVDWFRILSRKEGIQCSDVTILYLGRVPDDPTTTQVHPITLDELGNLEGVPKGYRDFFTDELWQLLGIDNED